MSNPQSDIERMVDEWERNSEQKAARYQAMTREVERISITESAAGGAVAVTVGNNGIPTNVSMTAKVRKMNPDQIAAAVMEAMTKAQAHYPQRLAEIMADTVGESPTTQQVLAQVQAKFPTSPDVSSSSASASSGGKQSAARGADDTDFSDRTILRRDR